MRKRYIGLLLIIMIMICGAAPALASDDLSVWDSWQSYPQDIMNTKYLIPVKYLMDKKILTGNTDGLFYPEEGITRAEFAAMMAKATNNTAEIEVVRNENIFYDLDGYGWARPYINAVAKKGLFKGRSDDRFSPGESVTYAEVITVIVRMNTNAESVAEGMAIKWPDNYILFAQTYNIIGDVEISDWNAPAKKGDAAILLYRNINKNRR